MFVCHKNKQIIQTGNMYAVSVKIKSKNGVNFGDKTYKAIYSVAFCFFLLKICKEFFQI